MFWSKPHIWCSFCYLVFHLLLSFPYFYFSITNTLYIHLHHLNSNIDISKLDVPEELKGEYECSITGNATYYFDLENGYYVGADIQMVMDVMMDSESETEDNFGMFMKMKSDNVYKIRLEKIEE